MRLSLRLAALAAVALLAAPSLRAQTAGGSAYLSAWTETTGAPTGTTTLARPFRDPQGRVYVAETWTIPGGSSNSNGNGGVGSRLHRWDGRRWSHLDVQFDDLYLAATRRNAVVTDLTLISGDTLVAATDFGPVKWTGTAWKPMYLTVAQAIPLGNPVTTASGAVSRVVYSAAEQRLYVSGSGFTVTQPNGGTLNSILTQQNSVGYLNLATRRWVGIGGSSTANVTDLLLGPDGKLYAAGSFTKIGGTGTAGFEAYAPYAAPTTARSVARFTGTGTAWEAVADGPGGSGVGTPHTMRFAGDGTLFVAGSFQSTSGRASSVWRYDGSAWTGVDVPGQESANRFELAPDGTLLIVTRQWTTHNAAGSTWRWTGSAWEELAGTLANFPIVASGAYAGVYFLKLTDAQAWVFEPTRTCVYGRFEFAIASGPGGVRTGYACRASSLASSESWTMQYPTGLIQGTVLATARATDGTLYAGGNFSQIGALTASSVAVKVGDDWVPVAGGPTTIGYLPGNVPLRLPGTVSALASDGVGGVYAGGTFTRVGGAATDNVGHIARFTPTGTPGAAGLSGTWASLGGGVTSSFGGGGGFVRHIVPSSLGVVVTGNFDYGLPTLGATGSARVDAKGLAIWTGTTWQGRAVNRYLTTPAAVGPDGTLYVFGAFTSISVNPYNGYAIPAQGVAKYILQDPAVPYSYTYWGPVGGGLPGTIRSLAFGSGGQLCAGGTFSFSSGGATAQNLACFDGTAWMPTAAFPGTAASSASPGDAAPHGTGAALAALPDVNALAGDGTALYVGGNGLLARYAGGTWTNLGGATPPTVTALALGPQGLDAMTPGGEIVTLAPGQLPVELTAFSAQSDGPGRVRVAWTTASETNNAGFAIEEITPSGRWAERATIAGRGTTTEAHAYAHTLDGLAPGRTRLRLVQRDLDGTAHVGPAVEVVVAGGGALAATAWPVPAQSVLYVRLSLAAPAAATARLYDALGREVARVEVPSGDAAPAFDLPVSGLAAGVYVLRVTAGREAVAVRVVVAR